MLINILRRYSQLELIGVGVSGLVWYDIPTLVPLRRHKLISQISFYSSAKDQISNQTVAVKKLAEPFKSDVVARHMFREIKLLKHLKHENVRQSNFT